MKEFSFSDLSRLVGQVIDAAMVEPVVLTKHGRRKLVMLPAAEYDRLVSGAVSDPLGGRGSAPVRQAEVEPKVSRISGLQQSTAEQDEP